MSSQSNPEIIVRGPRPGDEARWRELWRGYLKFYRTALPEDVTASVWRRILVPDPQILALVAEVDGRVAGLVHFLFHPVTWSTSDRCYLEDLFVDADVRGLGVGRCLIEAVYDAARQRGADQVYWLTEESNATARRLYDQIGHATPFIKYRGNAGED